MNYRLGIDLGGTSAKVALVTAGAGVPRIVKEGSVSTSGRPRPADLARQMWQVAKALAAGQKVTGLGVGVAGDIDFKKGVVRVSPNLGWKNVPLRALLQKESRLPVIVDNDANAAAWGIYRTQAPRSVRHMIAVTLGTGVGGGLIVDGVVHRGATGSAGEIGHMNVREDGPLCNCGLRGCLEAYCGRPYLERKVREALEKGQRSRLQTIYRKDPDEVTPFEMAKAAENGDTYARSVWNDVGHALGLVIGDLIYALNPEMIFLSGGIAQARRLVLDPLWRELKKRPFKAPVQGVRIQVADNAAQIGVLGASLL